MFSYKYNMRYIARTCLVWLALTSAGHCSSHLFVSFSMPDKLMEETLKESARLHIPATLNGLYQDSMPKTMEKIAKLTQKVPDLAFQIDPTAFERFNIHQVPALVVEQGDCFDVIYGTLTLTEGLNRIARRGECALKAGGV